uniref:DEP domain-containing protein n=1 Tax=Monopterus albus TaxID=43700 RepID=A0A3Q3IWK1_MONAL
MRGQCLYEKNSILQLREEHGVAYESSFSGCHLIDWLLQNGETESRCRGSELCRALQEHGIIQHQHDFFDSGLLYQFCICFHCCHHLSELLSEQDSDKEVMELSQKENSPYSPFVLCKSKAQEGSSAFQS